MGLESQVILAGSPTENDGRDHVPKSHKVSFLKMPTLVPRIAFVIPPILVYSPMQITSILLNQVFVHGIINQSLSFSQFEVAPFWRVLLNQCNGSLHSPAP